MILSRTVRTRTGMKRFLFLVYLWLTNLPTHDVKIFNHELEFADSNIIRPALAVACFSVHSIIQICSRLTFEGRQKVTQYIVRTPRKL